jgi:hypothetical protein
MTKHRTTLLAACLLLILPLHAHAQAAGYGDDMGMGMGAMPSVAKMSDGDASCEQLYAESEQLQKQIAALPKPEDPMAISQKMTDDIMNAQRKATQGARAKSFASTVLSMVPGVGGLAASALSPGMRSMPDTSADMQKHMKALQESTAANMAIYHRQARQQHVTDLFLERSCKVSQLQPDALARARAEFPSGEAVAAAMPATAAATSAGATPVEAALEASEAALPAATETATTP